MTTLETVRSQALSLSQRERAQLASDLLESLPPILDDEDGGVAEALRREAEAEADPSLMLTEEEFVAGIPVLRVK